MNVVLVLAEERAIRESLRVALPETDLLVFEVSAEDALRRLITVHADTLIIDDAPGLGHHALTRIRESVPGLPILILSSRGDSETLAAWTLAGASGYAVKHFSIEELQQALDSIMRRREAPADAIVVTGGNLERSGAVFPDLPKEAAISQHQMALRWLSRTSSHLEDPRRLCQNLVDSMTDIFDAIRSAVLLENQGGGVRIVASQGIAPVMTDSLRLSFSSGLMRWFEENACLCDRLAHAETPAAREMHVMGARLAVPLLCSGRVCGALAIGEKASGREYTFEERELLTMIGRCASTAFEKARVYHDASTQQDRLDRVLSSITAGVITVSANKTVAMMNQQAEQILHLREADVVGRSVQKLGSGFADLVLRTLADGKPRLRQELREPALNATLGLSVTPMDGEGVVVIFSRLPEEAVAKNDVLYSPFWEYLSDRVAQEIKNPMVAINTFAQLLPRKYDSEDFREAFARVVQKEVARINGVVETLFDFARRAELNLQRADVHETIRTVLREFEEELAARSITIETEFDPMGAQADLDVTGFSQAVHNVVQNSIDAMPSGGKIKVSTKREDDRCRIVIADTGRGITDEEAPLIFLPFYSTKERGMGLGLTTAARILRQHAGDVTLSETSPAGSVFSISVPAALP